MTASFDFESTSGLVPIFPLPDVCLLPGELLPLYVFEPRYRKLLAEALAGERLIALGRFQPGWEDNYYGNPPVYPCMGLGWIAAHCARPDGSSEIVLRGVERVRLLEVVRPMPFRLGRFAVLDEWTSSEEKLQRALLDIQDVLAAMRAGHAGPCDGIDLADADTHDLPGRLACALLYDADLKQRILEANDRTARMEHLLAELRSYERRHRMAELVHRLKPHGIGWN